MRNHEVSTFGQTLEKEFEGASREDLLRAIEESRHDETTRFYVRKPFCRKAQEMLETALRDRKPMAYLMVDIDHFKHVNDTYGHPVGDAVLAHVACMLKENVRTNTTNPAFERRQGTTDGVNDLVGIVNEETVEIGRVGGEEFGIALYGLDAQQAYRVAERVRTAIEQKPFSKDAVTIPITVSIGIATTETETTWDDIYHGADQALYCAKHNGRNRTELSSRGREAALPDATNGGHAKHTGGQFIAVQKYAIAS